MAKVTDATTAVGSSAGWFKISEMGLPSNNPEYWATEVLNVRLIVLQMVIFLSCLTNEDYHRTTAVTSLSLSQALHLASTCSVLRLSVCFTSFFYLAG